MCPDLVNRCIQCDEDQHVLKHQWIKYICIASKSYLNFDFDSVCAGPKYWTKLKNTKVVQMYLEGAVNV